MGASSSDADSEQGIAMIPVRVASGRVSRFALLENGCWMALERRLTRGAAQFSAAKAPKVPINHITLLLLRDGGRCQAR
jgi:hypothetical protein